MELKLGGHVAIVQGASKGLGRGIAEVLAEEGCDLVLTARNEGTLKETARTIAAKSGRRVVTVAHDSANLAGLEEQVRTAEREFGRLDVLVCNSGGPPPGTTLDLTPEQWAAAAQLLVTSPVMLLKHAMPLLRKSPAPRFFVVTSSSSKQPIPGLSLSNVFRPGVAGLIKTLADELGAERVRCHSIAPGRFDTDRLAHVIDINAKKNSISKAEARAAMEASIPAGRLGDPREIGNLVTFLSSERGEYLTGGNWLVDGGLVRSL